MNKRFKNGFIYFVLVFVLSALVYVFFYFYQLIFGASIETKGEFTYIYIKPENTYEEVLEEIYEQANIEHKLFFTQLASYMNYHNHIHPGRYRVDNGMSKRELLLRLRSAETEPIKLTINNIRTIEDFAGLVSNALYADSAQIVEYLNQDTVKEYLGLNDYTLLALVLPDTYFFEWHSDHEDVVRRMYREYQRFWTTERLESARKINMNPDEVITLASIIQEESTKADEWQRIAGVYINRLKRGMLLQADPTIKYLVRDQNVNRILYKHLEIESPYNTYKYAGLPPGPISIADRRVIDAVLNYEVHDFLYFCAKDDFSGYHEFSRTYNQHLQCRGRYTRALDRLGIMR